MMTKLIVKSYIGIVVIAVFLFCIVSFRSVTETHIIGSIRNCQRQIYVENHTSDPLYCARVQQMHLLTCNTSKYDLKIIVLVFDRSRSLLRLLESLNDAIYDGDKVKLEVRIDRSVHGNLDDETVKTAKAFSFKHGVYEVIPHLQHAGILGQWLSSWKPIRNSSEIAVICEDDITVSKYFYKYLKIVHRKYDNYPDINGYALQGLSKKHDQTDTSPLSGPNGSLVFLYPVVGSWGFSPCKDNWIHFQDWYMSVCSKENLDLSIPNRLSNKWLKVLKQPGKQNRIWTTWHIYHSYINSEYTLYTNIPGHVGFSTNWQEKGVHYGKYRGKSNELLQFWSEEFENLPTRPKLLDISGKILNSSY